MTNSVEAVHLFGHKVQWKEQPKDPQAPPVVRMGMVVGCDPQPLGQKEGDWLIISPDDDRDNWVPVLFGQVQDMEAE